MRFAFAVTLACAAAFLGACSGGTSSFYPAAPDAASLAPGQMSVSVEAQAPFDFAAHQYNVVFNTSGNGSTPASDRSQPNWSAYSYALIAGGDGKTTAGPVAFVRGRGAHAPAIVPLQAKPSQFVFDPNSDETGNEYRITFARSLLGRGGALPHVGNLWRFNVIVSKPNLHDAGFSYVSGIAPCRACFVSPKLDVTQPFDVVEYVRLAPRTGDPSTQIVRVEIANRP
ncbi:MAG TPA: hypothetical protein VMH02_12310 [Verrucomicrobiae bacterium]|nr:hypothetical protein [Verrucomicrobiae bacterium]